MFRAALAGVLLFAVACGSGGAGKTDSCRVGDPAASMELQLSFEAADGTTAPIVDMGRVPLVDAPQGGQILLIGARVRNLDGCSLTMTAALIDPGSNAVVSLEQRPVTLQSEGDGWLGPRPGLLSSFSNLPACPHANLTRSVNDEVYELKVTVEDAKGRKAEAAAMVVPACSNSGDCLCRCAKDYVLGATCDPPSG